MNKNANQTQELRARVRGLVQGVGFRYFVIEEGLRLGLRGYVRNTSSGDVEVVAQGPRPALERLLALLHRGPAGASVREVETTWQQPTEHFSGFNLRW
jgi:acylphosphatase